MGAAQLYERRTTELEVCAHKRSSGSQGRCCIRSTVSTVMTASFISINSLSASVCRLCLQYKQTNLEVE